MGGAEVGGGRDDIKSNAFHQGGSGALHINKMSKALGQGTSMLPGFVEIYAGIPDNKTKVQSPYVILTVNLDHWVWTTIQ